MALPFLPAEHIQPAFRCLRQLQTAPLQRLVDYVETNWIHNTIWPVESWSVYNQPTRTNNDVERVGTGASTKRPQTRRSHSTSLFHFFTKKQHFCLHNWRWWQKPSWPDNKGRHPDTYRPSSSK